MKKTIIVMGIVLLCGTHMHPMDPGQSTVTPAVKREDLQKTAIKIVNNIEKNLFKEINIGPMATKTQVLQAFGVNENETIDSAINKIKTFLVKTITDTLVRMEAQKKTQLRRPPEQRPLPGQTHFRIPIPRPHPPGHIAPGIDPTEIAP